MSSSLGPAIFLSAIVASVAFLDAADQPPRPTLEEWEEGQKNISDVSDAAAAKQAKMAAVDKVISMLEDLQLQVLAEGEAEAATYNKFACFCKTTQKDKTEAIKTGRDDKASLSADIERLIKERDELTKKIAELQEDIKKATEEMAKAKAESDAALKVYETNAADLEAALYALKEAIKVLKTSQSPSMAQLQTIGKTVKQAALIADVLGIGGKDVEKAAAFFLQQGDGDVPVEMEDYKFHSTGIINTLEKLLDSFRAEEENLDADEKRRVQEFTMFMQDRTDFIKAQTLSLKEAKASKEQKIEDIATASQELTTTNADLLSDMEYLDELNTVCHDKAKTWDQRTKMRANELTAITQATEIVKATVVEKTQASTIRFAQTGSVVHLTDAVANSDSALEAIEAEAEISEDADGAVPGFLQKRMVNKHRGPDMSDDGRQMVISLLKGTGQKLKSTLLVSLATRIAADPFAKVKKLIQELIERLLTEAANEADQKGWCDKAIADATQKRTYAADEVADLNSKMAKLEALSAKLGEKLKELSEQIAELVKARAEAEKNRSEEKAENQNTVSEAKAGLRAVKMALDILTKFYKTSAKATVDLSLAQGPLDDAPDSGFDIGEAYKGAQAESGGIIGMLEVIQSDFERTIKETEKDEKAAEQDHLEFMTATGKTLAEKEVAAKETKKYKDDADSNFNDAEEEMSAQTKILVTSIKELMELQPACIDTGMSYADRVALREEEIAALKKALCILGAYAEYGPDGLADKC
jgi:predicted  nucleic acid-binding Zn-ribbon protein